MKIYFLTSIILLSLPCIWSKSNASGTSSSPAMEMRLRNIANRNNTQKNTSKYHFAKQKMSFELAESYCKIKQMQLVNINDKETNQLVYDWAIRHNFGNYWINGNDKESEGVFVDSNKKRLTFTNWLPIQPDNYGNSEHCIHVIMYTNGLWNDVLCGNLFNVICEPIDSETSFELNNEKLKVAFFVGLKTGAIQNALQKDQAVFDNVVTNVGNAYNSVTGEFTAFVTGVYVFTVTVSNKRNLKAAVKLMHNEKRLMSIWCNDKSFGTSTSQAVLEMKEGDKIWLQYMPEHSNLYADMYSSFSGYLLFDLP